MTTNCGPVKLLSFTRLFQNKEEFQNSIERPISIKRLLAGNLCVVLIDVPLYNRDLTKLRQRRRKQTEHQKSNRFNEQNNNSARASRIFVHFFAVPVQLRHEMTKF